MSAFYDKTRLFSDSIMGAEPIKRLRVKAMYFSKHNENTVYINHYSGLLEVKGEGVLCKEDAEVLPDPKRDWKAEYHTLSVKEGITGLGEGSLEAFPNVVCLILERTVESVSVSRERRSGYSLQLFYAGKFRRQLRRR